MQNAKQGNRLQNEDYPALHGQFFWNNLFNIDVMRESAMDSQSKINHTAETKNNCGTFYMYIEEKSMLNTENPRFN